FSCAITTSPWPALFAASLPDGFRERKYGVDIYRNIALRRKRFRKIGRHAIVFGEPRLHTAAVTGSFHLEQLFCECGDGGGHAVHGDGVAARSSHWSARDSGWLRDDAL